MAEDNDDTKDLTEDLPKGLTTEEKLDWLMEMMQRFMAHDTNPLPPDYSARFTALEERLARIERKLNAMAGDVYDVRSAQTENERRLEALESRPN
jgi:hypothetical protein